ncbi:MAG: retropepsin-like domain-containing protein [Defluviitaleaceae bacterium]|nr:retropepsin-like domain-containing protein [Defluviitaleaceae bacterium]MCL2240645.1 retropepsin-like domain-containing protein [Defluviitaleaceae bacterium]
MFNVSYTHKDKLSVSKNKIFVDLYTVNDSHKPVEQLHIILDTGAFMTLIDKDVAVSSGYEIIEEKGCIISGFSEKGLLCDLRKISTLVFAGFKIKDVIIATPHEDDIGVAEVLGMNILENFNFHIDIETEEIYLNKRGAFTSQKPRYACGEINLFSGIQIPPK